MGFSIRFLAQMIQDRWPDADWRYQAQIWRMYTGVDEDGAWDHNSVEESKSLRFEQLLYEYLYLSDFVRFGHGCEPLGEAEWIGLTIGAPGEGYLWRSGRCSRLPQSSDDFQAVLIGCGQATIGSAELAREADGAREEGYDLDAGWRIELDSSSATLHDGYIAVDAAGALLDPAGNCCARLSYGGRISLAPSMDPGALRIVEAKGYDDHLSVTLTGPLQVSINDIVTKDHFTRVACSLAREKVETMARLASIGWWPADGELPAELTTSVQSVQIQPTGIVVRSASGWFGSLLDLPPDRRDQVKVEPPSFKFGEVHYHQKPALAVRVRHVGVDHVTVTNVVPPSSPLLQMVAPPFTDADGGSSAAAPVDLDSERDLEIKLILHPDVEDGVLLRDKITVIGSDPDRRVVIPIEATLAPARRIYTCSTFRLADTYQPQVPIEGVFEIQSVGERPAQITSLIVTDSTTRIDRPLRDLHARGPDAAAAKVAEFSLVDCPDLPFEIPPGQKVPIKVRFVGGLTASTGLSSPLAALHSCRIVIHSNAQPSPASIYTYIAPPPLQVDVPEVRARLREEFWKVREQLRLRLPLTACAEDRARLWAEVRDIEALLPSSPEAPTGRVSDAPIEIAVGEYSIRVRPGFDEDTLHRALGALRRITRP